MKAHLTFVLLVIIFVFASFNAECQWHFVYIPDYITQYDLSFPDVNTGFICGDKHRILKTVDGGTNWEQMTINAKGNFVSVNFPSHNIGFVASDSGDVLKTTDAGQSWNLIKSFIKTPGQTFRIRLFFLNNDSGYMVCDSSAIRARIYRTTNGGLSWNSFVFPDTVYFRHPMAIDFLNDSVGYILHNTGIVKTIDRGLSWYQIEHYWGGNSFSFLNESHGFLISNGALYESTDGGIIWNFINNDFFPSFVYFTSPDTGYLSLDTIVLQTRDAGNSWLPMKMYETGPGVAYLSTGVMCWPTHNIGYLIGNAQCIFRCNLGASGIEDKVDVQSFIQLIQNPVNGSLIRFRINSNHLSGIIILFTILGKEVKKITGFENQEVDIDRSDLSPGIYFFEYFEGDKMIADGKIILN